MRIETGTDSIQFKYIPPKFVNISAIDYCYRLLKQALYNQHSKILDRLWKTVVEIREKINAGILRKALVKV